MRSALSLILLAIQGTLRRVILLLALIAAVEGALFYLALGRMPPDFLWSLEDVFTRGHVGWAFIGGLLLLSALLSLNGCEFSGSKLGYTLQRLSISERMAALCWAAYNFGCLILFWASQILVMLLLCRLYLSRVDPAYASTQTVFLAFYRQPLLHSLLPLAESSRALCNGVLFAAMALCQAAFSFHARHGRKGVAAAVLSVVGAFAFARSMGSWTGDSVLGLFAVITGAFAFANIWGVSDDETV